MNTALADTRHATAHLTASDPDWGVLIALIGPCTMETESAREPYMALVHAVAHQHIHGRAALAMLGRFLALYPGVDFPSPQDILATDAEILGGCGFSAAKIATIRGIALQTASGAVPSRAAARLLEDEVLIEQLSALHGIGRWTVEMLLMNTLGRPDVLPVGDFGIREGWRLIKGLEKQPTQREMAAIGEQWRPYRSIASWYLWRAVDHYRLVQRAGSGN